MLGHLQSTWPWVQCRLQKGQALTGGSTDRAASALFSPCERRSHRLRKACTRWRSDVHGEIKRQVRPIDESRSVSAERPGRIGDGHGLTDRPIPVDDSGWNGESPGGRCCPVLPIAMTSLG